MNALVEAANAGAIPEAAAVKDIEAMRFALGELEMAGHVGALYFQNIREPSKPFQLTKGTERFHNALAAQARGTDDVLTFLGQLENFVETEVWDGHIEEPDAAKVPKLDRAVNQVPVEFRGKGDKALRADVRNHRGEIVRPNGGAVISTLKELGERQKVRRSEILRMVAAVRDELRAMGGKR